jgi:hypothetical protein
MTERERQHLVQADRHIAECKAHIAQQRKLIEMEISKGHSPKVADSMLLALEESLRAFERHRQLILDRLKSESRSPPPARTGS